MIRIEWRIDVWGNFLGWVGQHRGGMSGDRCAGGTRTERSLDLL